ncbi:hypothetical protein D0Z07_7502 [Hyphodiscus hymeniophilus]|uniref:Uncharacterized protein n=1 Tax=Hyphodiscus hymeniophilus TaxID=353542 RepID=A0A9P7AU81_9HELO|nr:hypothetical protein D0Z07_7502 [Hyphodiscus hymeniophilus]
MDDPWGSSPWADENELPVAATKVRDDAEDIDARPKTPVIASTSGPGVNADSPWNDEDDGFGEWAAVPAVGEVKDGGMGLDGAGDAWEDRETDNGTINTKKNDFDGLSWNDDMSVQGDTNSRVSPSLLPISQAPVRPPSPDPWAVETTLNHGHGDDTHGLETSKQVAEIKEGMVEDGLLGGITEPLQEINAETLTELLPENTETTPTTRTLNGSDVEQSHVDWQKFEAEPTETTEETREGHDAGEESPRSSSSPSDQSHHDEIVTESPRTSLDEEPRRIQVSRKVSSKIQDRVEHFDGLARQVDDIAIVPSRSRSRSETPSLGKNQTSVDHEEPLEGARKTEDDDDEFGDFGDFEDGESEAQEVMEVKLERPMTPIQAQIQPASSPASKCPSSHNSSPQSRYVKKDFGPVEFTVDTTILEKFYSQAGGDALQDVPTENVFIMDSIPYDSFHTLEERKTWYRVSRYGSMRKHNSGDDDNYVRVTWPQSQIREQTLTTVGRWMEEDRISGRVVLGGGSKGSSIFGWNDPNAPAVPLASAFGAKQGRGPTPISSPADPTHEVPREWPKGLVRDGSRSKSRSSPEARRNSTKSGSISESHKDSPQAPLASFGWNARPETTGQKAIPLSKEPPQAAAVNANLALSPRQSTSTGPRLINSTIVIPVDDSQTRTNSALSGEHLLPISTSNLGAVPPILSALSNVDDDDDEWGEMIASPVASTAPVISSLQVLQHKKSQSLNEAFPSPYAQPKDSAISLQSLPSHKSPTSFDDILVPQSRNSSGLKSYPSPSSMFSASASFVTPVNQILPSPVTSTTSNHDPWASADFSFFDSHVPVSEPAPKPVLVAVPKPMPKAVSFAKAPPAPSSLRHGKTRQEMEQDEIVSRIVKSLPDLSYMLRR